MKIPETSANIGAYYGNEENGQWQPNGVILDSGVGGGVVGSGDAGVHRPHMYPVHVRPHIPAGYVVPAYYAGGGGGYGPPPHPPPPPPPPPHHPPAHHTHTAPTPDDFADYMWMENEEEFDKQVMQQLEEEALMEQCIEAMLEDEQRELRQQRTQNGQPRQCPNANNVGGGCQVSLEEAVSRSTLNPLAAEFVPTRRPPAPSERDIHSEPREDREPTSISETSLQAEALAARLSAGDASAALHCPDSALSTTDMAEPVSTEAVAPAQVVENPPEVSAAELHTDSNELRHGKVQSSSAKTESKKKPVTGTKSETKVQAKSEPKKEREDSAELRIEEKNDSDSVKPQQQQQPQPPQQQAQITTTTEEPVSTGPKPINYAAAARANKAKKIAAAPANVQPASKQLTEKQSATKVNEKASVTKVVEKTTPKIVEKAPSKSEIKIEKKAKPVQRKNSVK